MDHNELTNLLKQHVPKPSERFVQQLWNEVTNQPTPMKKHSMTRQQFIFTTVLTAVVLIAAVGVAIVELPSRKAGSSTQIIAVAPGAFGSLTTSANLMGRGSGAESASAVAPMTAMADQKMAAPGIVAGDTASSMMYRPSVTYKAPAFTLANVPARAFKRLSGTLGEKMSALVAGNWRFSRTAAQTTSVSVKSLNGYDMTIMLDQGTFSMNRSYSSVTTKESVDMEMPIPMQDEEMLALAKSFVADHAIAVSGLGDPVVVKEVGYDSGWAQVVWPETVAGIPVVDGSGNPSGVQVSISTSSRTVESAYGTLRQGYQSSAYDLASVADITKLAEGGGYSYAYPMIDATTNSQEAQVVRTLQEPKLVLTEQYAKDGVFLVPTYMFEIAGAERYEATKVLIPLLSQLVADRVQSCSGTECAVMLKATSAGSPVAQ